MNKLYIFLIFICFCEVVKCQGYTVSGYVTDADNGETIIGVTVVAKGSTLATITDLNGYFRLAGLSKGEHILVFSHLSYIDIERKVIIENKSKVLDETQMKPDLISLSGVSIVEVKPDEVGDKSIETSQLELSAKTIRSIPSARNDIFKAIKYLPGIEATEPFSPLYSARGGDPGENRIILDGVPIYNPYHYSSASGIFNMQTIKNVDLLVGGFGSEFGGSNSSIMYITTKDGNSNELEGEVEPSLLQTQGAIEFPVGNKSTAMVAGRYFYNLPAYFMFYSQSYFYDLNLSYTWRINNKNRLAVKLFHSKDYNNHDMNQFLSYLANSFSLEFYDDFHMVLKNKWNNHSGSIVLKSILSPRLFLRTQVYGSLHSADNYSELNFTYPVEDSETNEIVQLYYNSTFKSQIEDLGAKSSLSYKLSSFSTLKIGVDYNTYYFRNGAIINDFNRGDETRDPYLIAGFLEDKLQIGPVIIRPGIRASKYSYFNDIFYEPRINANIRLSKTLKLKAAWGTFYQYIISMNTQEFEISQFLDYYYPLKNNDPSKSLHYILGFEKDLFNTTNLSVEFYYKDIQRTYTFDLNQSDFEAFTFSSRILEGTGKAYGMELMWKGSWNKLSGWISYCLSKSKRSFDHIMNGQEFLFDYDRTHSFNALINYHISPSLSYSTTFVLLTGNPRSIESSMHSYFYYDPVENHYSFYPISVSNKKNNARLPMIIEWDIGLKKQLRNGIGAELADFLHADESYLSVSVQNILFLKRNVLWYFPIAGDKYLPIGTNYIPSANITYSLKF